MSLLELYPDEQINARCPEPLTLSRSDILTAITSKRRYDIVVVGGGIHGAVFARLAAFNGLKTLLVERGDYANATSSRSSKMAHGGLRYLQMLDLRQVFEGIRARDDLFRTADHLVKPTQFLLPVRKGDRLERWKLALGLTLYDLLLSNRSLRHHYVSAIEGESSSCGLDPARYQGFFRYTDGVMDDTRLVLENILAARQEGALCSNYIEVVSLSQSLGGDVGVGCRDLLSGSNFEVSAGIVVNCAGPWVASVGRLTPGPLQQRIVYSRGSHLLFSKPWQAEPVLFPLEGGRAYWIWPHPAGTLVGTTEREVAGADADPLPSPDEIEEILDRLQRDLPGAELSRSSIHYVYGGVRTLVRRKAAGSSALSRRHVWHYAQGVLSLLGGKFTTASWTAYEGLCKVYRIAGLQGKPTSLYGRLLPGAGLTSERVTKFRREATERGLEAADIERLLRMYGGRSSEILEFPEGARRLAGGVLCGELSYACSVEQGCTVEDILRRRVQLEYHPGHGLELLDRVAATLGSCYPERDFSAEVEGYRTRMQRIRHLISGLE